MKPEVIDLALTVTGSSENEAGNHAMAVADAVNDELALVGPVTSDGPNRYRFTFAVPVGQPVYEDAGEGLDAAVEGLKTLAQDMAAQYDIPLDEAVERIREDLTSTAPPLKVASEDDSALAYRQRELMKKAGSGVFAVKRYSTSVLSPWWGDFALETGGFPGQIDLEAVVDRYLPSGTTIRVTVDVLEEGGPWVEDVNPYRLQRQERRPGSDFKSEAQLAAGPNVKAD